MPRKARAAVGGIVYHVHNRGNGRTPIFRTPEDYLAFLEVLRDGKEKAGVELFGFCLMPDHWHLVLRPKRDADLSKYLSWVSNTHVRRYRVKYPKTSGHLYRGRYKSFPVDNDAGLLNLLRFVESNPRRMKLVPRAEDWQWSSLGCDPKWRRDLLDAWPTDRPRNWTTLVNKPLESKVQQKIMEGLGRGRPLGSDAWTKRTVQRLGLQHTFNPRGRPRKIPATSKK